MNKYGLLYSFVVTWAVFYIWSVNRTFPTEWNHDLQSTSHDVRGGDLLRVPLEVIFLNLIIVSDVSGIAIVYMSNSVHRGWGVKWIIPLPQLPHSLCINSLYSWNCSTFPPGVYSLTSIFVKVDISSDGSIDSSTFMFQVVQYNTD